MPTLELSTQDEKFLSALKIAVEPSDQPTLIDPAADESLLLASARHFEDAYRKKCADAKRVRARLKVQLDRNAWLESSNLNAWTVALVAVAVACLFAVLYGLKLLGR